MTGESTSSKAQALQKRKDSVTRKLHNSNTERNILKEATHEAITLSLDPKKKKKQMPRHLAPIQSKRGETPKNKASGNYALEVLKDLETRKQEKAKERRAVMK